MTNENWYAEHRLEIEALFETAVEKEESVETDVSPSGRYQLRTAVVALAESKWNYSLGHVTRQDGNALTLIHRNISNFPATWVEGHPDGHDYLIAGEDYQGQTVVQLDTGKRIDYISDEARDGSGFCWVEHYVSADSKTLFVDGCYWGFPYEIVQFDFSQPMTLPYPEIGRWSVWEVEGFRADGSFVWSDKEEFRKRDGLALADLSEEDSAAFRLEENHRDEIGTRSRRFVWTPDDNFGTVAQINLQDVKNG